MVKAISTPSTLDCTGGGPAAPSWFCYAVGTVGLGCLLMACSTGFQRGSEILHGRPAFFDFDIYHAQARALANGSGNLVERWTYSPFALLLVWPLSLCFAHHRAYRVARGTGGVARLADARGGAVATGGSLQETCRSGGSGFHIDQRSLATQSRNPFGTVSSAQFQVAPASVQLRSRRYRPTARSSRQFGQICAILRPTRARHRPLAPSAALIRARSNSTTRDCAQAGAPAGASRSRSARWASPGGPPCRSSPPRWHAERRRPRRWRRRGRRRCDLEGEPWADRARAT
jgi:hypothetical protein